MTNNHSETNPINKDKLRRRFNPEGSPLRKHQMLMLDMLKKIDGICRANDIKYWLSSGSCLGALRHGGFIPWDDDVDIEMLKPDFVRLRDIMRNYDGKDLVWQDSKSDPEYVQPFAKIRDTHTIIEEVEGTQANYRYCGVFIDVFVIQPSSSLFLSKFACKLQSIFLFRPMSIRNRYLRKTILSFSRIFISKAVFSVISAINRLSSNGQYRHIPGTAFHKPRYYNDVSSTRLVPFEDTVLPVPVNAEHYLEMIYGDYMRLPDLNRITPHISKIKYLV